MAVSRPRRAIWHRFLSCRCRYIAPLLLMLGLTACGRASARPMPTIMPRPTSVPADSIPGLAEALTEVSAIALADDWSGLALYSPLLAHTEVVRQDAGYVGTTCFSAGSYDPAYRRGQIAERPAVIPPDAAQESLALLAGLRGYPGHYVPHITYFDSYPSLRMVLSTARGKVTIFSRSQGNGNSPWGLMIDGREYVIAGDSPLRALLRLRAYTDYSTLDRLKVAAGASTPADPPPPSDPCVLRLFPERATPAVTDAPRKTATPGASPIPIRSVVDPPR